LVVPVVVIAAWWIVGASMSGLKGEIIARPPEILSALIRQLGSSSLYVNLGVTLREYVIALVISLTAAVVLGLLIGSSRLAIRLLEPIIYAFYSVPKVALYPILLIVLGLTTKTITALGVMQGFYPAFFATLAGFKAINPLYLEVARSLESSRLQTYRKVVLRAVMGSVIAGARVSAVMCFHGVVTGEIISGTEGMGYQVINYYDNFDYPNMYASIIVTALIVVAVFGLATLAERKLLRLVREG
jgi:NitT/TauT family transport system permease protein